MNEEFYWAAFVLVWVFGWVTVWLRRKKAREALTLRRREMLHQERLAAIAKGLPLLDLAEADEEVPEWLSAEAERFRTRWILRLSLITGLVAVATGVGICVAFYWAPDPGFRAMWTLGFVPFFGGLGFLLFWRLASAWDRPQQDPR